MSVSYDLVEISSAAEWRAWLAANHAASPGIWLVTWKKGYGPHVSYSDIVDEAISFGWVDSRPRRIDASRSARLLTPRRVGSAWVEGEQAAGRAAHRCRPDAADGLAAVDRARVDGSWDALAEVEELAEPGDLATALAANPPAGQAWDSFPRSAKRAILEWISNAKTAPTRQRRINQTVAEAALGRRANQWRQPAVK